MNPKQPPQGFYSSGPAVPPPQQKNRSVLVVVVLAVVLVLMGMVGAGALFWISASDADPLRPDGDVPADGMRHYDLQWQLESSGTKASLRGVWSSGETVHAVGDGGVVLTRDASGTWSAQSSGTKANLHAITSTSAGLMAVGDEGTVLIFDRASRSWSRETTGTNASLRAVISAGGEIVAAGTKGTIIRRNAKDDWGIEPAGVEVDLYALSTPNANDPLDKSLYAAGADGTILHRAGAKEGGSAWVVQGSGTKGGLFALKGAMDQLLAVGEGGGVLRLRASSDTPWTSERVEGAVDLMAVDFAHVRFALRRPGYFQSGTEPCWLVAGKGGFVAIRPENGADSWFVIEPKPTSENLLAVSSGRGEFVVLVGENGTIVTGRTNPL